MGRCAAAQVLQRASTHALRNQGQRAHFIRINTAAVGMCSPEVHNTAWRSRCSGAGQWRRVPLRQQAQPVTLRLSGHLMCLHEHDRLY